MATSNQDELDPSAAQTPEAFMQLLVKARAASGLSIVEIAERARERGYELDPVNLALALREPTLPPWQMVTGVLTACGLGGMAIDRWMRVYHDLAAPAQPVVAVPTDAVATTAVQEPIDVEPIDVPPLVLTTAPATPSRLGPKHFGFAAAVLAALIIVPLTLFNLFGSEPDPVAGEQTGTTESTSQAPPPAPSATDVPVAQPTPTPPVAPTTPAVVTTTVKPPPPKTTTAAPPPSPAPPPPPPGDPGVLHTGVVALSGNQGFDLDTGQSEGERDFFRWDGDTLARMNGGRLAYADPTPTKQNCQSERHWNNWIDNLSAGQWLCVFTSEGRLASLNITAVGSTVKVAYTVWR